MKLFLLGSAACFALGCGVCAQTPGPVAPSAPPLESAAPSATGTSIPTVSPAISATPAATASAHELADEIKQKVDRKFKHKGNFGITIDDKDDDAHVRSDGDIPKSVLPIVAITMLAIFGLPVAIVAVIMFSSWAKTRSLHRTVRMMVEKGQPVPPELLASPAGAPLRPWYDLRRGIVLLAVGVGIVMFFGISAGWDEGVWALGLIPGLIGLGYILAWRLANHHGDGFNK
jgi:Domain of unknown function (DUF6249)